jgi:hypothetical protein
MLLVAVFIVGLDLAGFFWFRSWCRTAVRAYTSSLKDADETKLIPFERGMTLQGEKEPRAV